MTEVLTCIEHQSLPVKRTREPGEFAISDAHATELELARNIPKTAFSFGNRQIKWAQYCGVIQLKGLTIEILPKLHGYESQPGSCRDLLVRMLKRAGMMRVHKGAEAGIDLQSHSLLDIFILEFCAELQSQLQMGKPVDYRQREENLRVVKGKLLIHDQLRANFAHPEQVYCEFDELSEDIPLNQIIRFTLLLLSRQSARFAVRRALDDLLMRYDSVSDREVNSEAVMAFDLDRTSFRYSAVLAWCRIFISAMNPDVSAGKERLFSLLFDMNLLFEKWVAAEIRPIAYRAGLRLREQSPIRYLAYRADIDRQVFQTKPDIALLDRGGEICFILDAKWKLLESREHKLGVNQGDLYQLISYARLYGVQKLFLVYPRQADLGSRYEFEIGGDPSIRVMVICFSMTSRNSLDNQLSSYLSTQ